GREECLLVRRGSEGAGELRWREDARRRLPPLIHGLAAALLEERRDGVGRLTAGRGHDDDLAGAERASVAPADLLRQPGSRDQATEDLRDRRAQPAPSFEREPGAVAGDERRALAIRREDGDVLLAHAGFAQERDRLDRGVVVRERGAR